MAGGAVLLPSGAACAAAGETLPELPEAALRPRLCLLPAQPSAGVGQVRGFLSQS